LARLTACINHHRNRVVMASFNDDDLSERRTAAANAKKAMVERFLARPAASDPANMKRKAARMATSEDRKARVAERAEARRAATEREAVELKLREEDAARLAATQAERQAAERRADADQAVKLLAEQKAARDLRYAARKARR
jgi:hypothetical protein